MTHDAEDGLPSRFSKTTEAYRDADAKLVRARVAQGGVLTSKHYREYDLSGLDLSGKDLDGIDFGRANLDGAILNGCSAVGASFAGASMRGVQADGLHAPGVSFRGARLDALKPSGKEAGRSTHVRGAILTRADFSGAVLDGALFDDARMDGASLGRASARETSFAAADLRGADFAFGTFAKCAFDGADLTSGSVVDLRDRCVGTTAVGGGYEGAKFDDATKAFEHDALWGKVRKAMATGVSGVALFGVAKLLHLEQAEALGEFVSENRMTIVGVAMVAALLKDKAVEMAKDMVGEEWAGIQDGVRAFVKANARVLRNVANLGVAVVRGPGIEAVCAAFDRVGDKRPIMAEIKDRTASRVDGGTTVVFASRKRLALALEALDTLWRSDRRNGDLYLLRDDSFEAGDRAPTLVKFGYDGTKSFVWTRDGKVTKSASYDVDDRLLHSEGGHVLPVGVPYVRGFQKALLSQYDVPLRNDRATTDLRAGRDGSILVVDKATGLLDNALGPAVVALDGKARVFREGREVEPDAELAIPTNPSFA